MGQSISCRVMYPCRTTHTMAISLHYPLQRTLASLVLASSANLSTTVATVIPACLLPFAAVGMAFSPEGQASIGTGPMGSEVVGNCSPASSRGSGPVAVEPLSWERATVLGMPTLSHTDMKKPPSCKTCLLMHCLHRRRLRFKKLKLLLSMFLCLERILQDVQLTVKCKL